MYDRLETLAATPRPVSPQLQSFVMGLKADLPARPAQGILATAAPASATRTGAIVFSVKPEQKLEQTLLRATGKSPELLAGKGPETFLMIEGLPKPGNATTAFRVFLNTKDVGPTTPVTSPGYAGTIAFFGDGAHAGHGGQRTFILDVADTLAMPGFEMQRQCRCCAVAGQPGWRSDGRSKPPGEGPTSSPGLTSRSCHHRKSSRCAIPKPAL